MVRQAFWNAFSAVLGREPGIVVIHSSIANLAPPSEFRKQDVLDALDRLIETGWTIALPAFTFSFCQGRPFHSSRSPSEVGLLADWFLDAGNGARRTPHPIYSFAVAGSAADRIAGCPSTTTFGDDSPFGLFEQENATLVMLGCGWKYCTQFHRYEEQAAVPYRYFKEFVGQADLGDGKGEHEVRAAMYVRDLAINPVNDFTAVEQRMHDAGIVASVPLLRREMESAPVNELARISREMLNADPLAFLGNRAEIAHALASRTRAAKESTLNVAVLGHSNIHLLRSALENELAALLPERRAEIFECPYGQVRQMALDAVSPLRRLQPQISIFCDRLEDLVDQPRLDGIAPERLDELVSDYADLIADYHTGNGGWSIVHRFALLDPSVDEGNGAWPVRIDQLNALVRERLAGLEQLVWVDVAAEAAASETSAVDPRLWFLGRFPWSEPFSRRLARRWTGILLAILGKTARVVVLDLDNTLWGGVLGEDGLEGVQIGGDYPGNAYAAFQRALKAVARRGVALAVCSKNDRDLALRALETLPEMQIRSADLAAHRINWQAKWLNIQEIAEELNLGLESVLYVDDNPVEREAVRRNLPAVKVLDLPADPADYAEALSTCPWLQTAGVTAEDRQRGDAYHARRKVQEERQAAANLTDFYAGLEMRLEFQPLNPGNLARAAQLSQKTNQFNTTTRRYEQRDLRRIVEQGGNVIVIGLADRYTPFENIGLLILKADADQPGQGFIDNYLLSCRVLGRGLEPAILQWAIGYAAGRDWKILRGLIVETERNTPVRSVFREAGFQPGDKPGEWFARTDSGARILPWLTVIDRTGTEANIEATGTPASAAAEAPRPVVASEDGHSLAGPLVRKLLRLPANADLSDAGLGVTPGWDSLKHIELLLALESALGIRFGAGEMEFLHRFTELDALCQKKLAARGSR
ncbi:MAG TPA: HAD-IIIC family phosphatase [Planctomycetaceae bacterium]|jgi:FkbH-like protein|nr:HAD-IIIC family phosphatase [Planctomycetaceae bacterium]